MKTAQPIPILQLYSERFRRLLRVTTLTQPGTGKHLGSHGCPQLLHSFWCWLQSLTRARDDVIADVEMYSRDQIS